MTDPPTQAELAAQTVVETAAAKVAHSAFTFQIAALRFSNASDDELLAYAREYVKRMRYHQKAVEEAHEAFKEYPA